jgi:hypothetical protein
MCSFVSIIKSWGYFALTYGLEGERRNANLFKMCYHKDEDSGEIKALCAALEASNRHS